MSLIYIYYSHSLQKSAKSNIKIIKLYFDIFSKLTTSLFNLYMFQYKEFYLLMNLSKHY